MKRLFIFLLTIASFCATAQRYSGDEIIGRKGYWLKDRWIRGFKNDTTGFDNSDTTLPTAKAVANYISNKLRAVAFYNDSAVFYSNLLKLNNGYIQQAGSGIQKSITLANIDSVTGTGIGNYSKGAAFGVFGNKYGLGYGSDLTGGIEALIDASFTANANFHIGNKIGYQVPGATYYLLKMDTMQAQFYKPVFTPSPLTTDSSDRVITTKTVKQLLIGQLAQGFYYGDGTLTSNRTVDANKNTLAFNNLQRFQITDTNTVFKKGIDYKFNPAGFGSNSQIIYYYNNDSSAQSILYFKRPYGRTADTADEYSIRLVGSHNSTTFNGFTTGAIHRADRMPLTFMTDRTGSSIAYPIQFYIGPSWGGFGNLGTPSFEMNTNGLLGNTRSFGDSSDYFASTKYVKQAISGNISGNAANVTGTVAAANGGTGQTSYTIGDILYASTTTALSKLAGVATGNALISGGTGTPPSWGKIGLTTHVSGTLPVANGGTGATTANAALNALLPTQTSNANRILTTDGTNASWQTNAAPTITSGTAAPASAPGKIGDIYVDTTARKLYFAVGNSSSADWELVN